MYEAWYRKAGSQNWHKKLFWCNNIFVVASPLVRGRGLKPLLLLTTSAFAQSPLVRGRGLKHYEYIIKEALVRRPSYGGVDWNMHDIIGIRRNLSRPSYGGVDWNYLCGYCFAIARVAPRTGAWIETAISGQLTVYMRSPLVRGRGLKHNPERIKKIP